jgi:hypothetical protein
MYVSLVDAHEWAYVVCTSSFHTYFLLIELTPLHVITCSMLQDVMQNEEVSRLVLQATGRSFLSAAKELCAEAMIQGSTDNVTALVIDLRYASCLHLHLRLLQLDFLSVMTKLSLHLLLNQSIYLPIQESFIIYPILFICPDIYTLKVHVVIMTERHYLPNHIKNYTLQ